MKGMKQSTTSMHHLSRRRHANKTKSKSRLKPSNSNSIEAHEQILGSALVDTSIRFQAIHEKLKNYKQKSNRSSRSLKTVEWLTEWRDIVREEQRLSKQMKAMMIANNKDLRTHTVGSNASTTSSSSRNISISNPHNNTHDDLDEFAKKLRIMFLHDMGHEHAHVGLACEDSSSTHDHPGHVKIKSNRKHLCELEEEMEQELRRISEEIEVLEIGLKGDRDQDRCSARNSGGGVRRDTHDHSMKRLPMEIIDAEKNLRTEFDLILCEGYVQGMGSELHHDIQMLTNAIAANFNPFDDDCDSRSDTGTTNDCSFIPASSSSSFSQSFTDCNSIKNTKDDSSCNVAKEDQQWDERCQLILRNGFKQWSKTRSVRSKASYLQNIAKHTGMTLLQSKSAWDSLESSKIASFRHQEQRNERNKYKHEMTKLGLADIEMMRRDTIGNLAQMVSVNLNDEVVLEHEHKLDILRALGKHLEQRQQDEMQRSRLIFDEKTRHLHMKRKLDLSANREKVRLYLEQKETEVYLARLEDLSHQKEEEDARLQRMTKNKQRVQFRQRHLENKIESSIIKSRRMSKDKVLKEQRLNALAASVPYYEVVKSAKSNIHRTTLARMNDVYEPATDSNLCEFQLGISTAFTNEKIFSDPKFRLAHQLHESGLAQSSYSQAVVKRLIPREVERTTGIQPY